MDLEGKSLWTFLIPLASTLASLVVYIQALPRFGVYGALIGLIVNALTRTLINNALAYYYLPRPYYFNKILAAWAASVVFYILLSHISIQNTTASVAVKLLIIAVFAFVQMGLIIRSELKDLYRSVNT